MCSSQERSTATCVRVSEGDVIKAKTEYMPYLNLLFMMFVKVMPVMIGFISLSIYSLQEILLLETSIIEKLVLYLGMNQAYLYDGVTVSVYH